MLKTPRSGGTLAGLEKKLTGNSRTTRTSPARCAGPSGSCCSAAPSPLLWASSSSSPRSPTRTRIDSSGKKLTRRSCHRQRRLIISYAIYVLLWVLMARMNRAGHGWARIVSSVLFAISTWQLYRTIDALHGGEIVTLPTSSSSSSRSAPGRRAWARRHCSGGRTPPRTSSHGPYPGGHAGPVTLFATEGYRLETLVASSRLPRYLAGFARPLWTNPTRGRKQG